MIVTVETVVGSESKHSSFDAFFNFSLLFTAAMIAQSQYYIIVSNSAQLEVKGRL